MMVILSMNNKVKKMKNKGLFFSCITIFCLAILCLTTLSFKISSFDFAINKEKSFEYQNDILETETIIEKNGDVDLNGVVNVIDCVVISKYCKQEKVLSKIALFFADVNDDKTVDLTDAEIIADYLSQRKYLNTQVF